MRFADNLAATSSTATSGAGDTPTVLRSVLAPLFKVAEVYPDAEELVVNVPGEVCVERTNGIWTSVAQPGLTVRTLHAMALAVAKATAQAFDDKNTILFGTLPTGERLTFVGPPTTPPGIIALTMRLVKNAERTMAAYDGTDFFDRFTWLQADAVRAAAVEQEDRNLLQLLQERRLRDFLIEAVKSRLTVGIIGDTGSGKTFLMECLIQSIPVEERLVTIESARELKLHRHPNKVQMLYSHFRTSAAAVHVDELEESTKRLKPKRVLFGECIGAEALAFLNMVISGHAGSITSWHAKSIDLARDRFVLMCGKHPQAARYSHEHLNHLYDQAMDVVVYIHVKKDAEGRKHRYIRDVFFQPRGTAG